MQPFYIRHVCQNLCLLLAISMFVSLTEIFSYYILLKYLNTFSRFAVFQLSLSGSSFPVSSYFATVRTQAEYIAFIVLNLCMS
jgi:hypothetical protein